MATIPDGKPSGSLTSTSAAATRRVGQRLGRAAPPGTCLALVGPLGAGKTQLTKGIAQGLGVQSVVNSPTFIIVNEHGGRLPLFHVDAYRLTDGDEALHAGVFDERQADGVTVIEWADRLEAWLPGDLLKIEIEHDGAGPDIRILRWRATGPRHAALARVLGGAEAA